MCLYLSLLSLSLCLSVSMSLSLSLSLCNSLTSRLYPDLYEWVVNKGGSISAEHGIGQMKLAYSDYGKSQVERELVKKLKSLFDPNGILNPYKFVN